MSAERADNYRVLQDMKIKDPQSACYIQQMINQILETARKRGTPITSAIVITDDEMTQEEKEMALFWGFLREGYSLEEAERKVKEWIKEERELDRKFEEIEKKRTNKFWSGENQEITLEN